MRELARAIEFRNKGLAVEAMMSGRPVLLLSGHHGNWEMAVSVFGPNGCGKSTLINMIAGLIPVDAGEILFDGKPLRELVDREAGY